MNKSSIILLFLSLANPWLWRIFNLNVFVAALIIIISFSLFNLLLKHRFSSKYFVGTLILFIILSIIGVKLGYDRNLRKLQINEEVSLNQRNRYYSKELGKLFLNRYVLNYYQNYSPFFYKFESNFFSVLDPNLYFFASHPQERAGINEFEKFPSVYYIFFILGIIYVLQLQPLLLLVYLLITALISGFISPAFNLGPFLLFPIITTLTSLGVIYLIILLKYFLKKIN